MPKDTDKSILIADYGRSGQGWLSYMLCYILNARYIEPYCLLRGIVYSGHPFIIELTQGNLPGREPSKYSLVIKTHTYPDPFFSLTDKVILLARDPRDVASSAHARFGVMEESGTDVEVGAQKEALTRSTFNPHKRIRERLMAWLWSKKAFCFAMTARQWRNFYNAWEGIDFSHRVTYEELSKNPRGTLEGILAYLQINAADALIDEAIEKFAFESITKRRKGSEDKKDVAFRKGAVGDYRNHFNTFYLWLFRRLCGEAARKVGILDMSRCRICDSPTAPFMSFGQMPIANGFLTEERFAQEYFFELAIAFCAHCGMVQLVEQPARERMFNEHYAFFSGTSTAMAEHFREFADRVIAGYLPAQDPFVAEIGSNDGIMLQRFSEKHIRHLGNRALANF